MLAFKSLQYSYPRVKNINLSFFTQIWHITLQSNTGPAHGIILEWGINLGLADAYLVFLLKKENGCINRKLQPKRIKIQIKKCKNNDGGGNGDDERR